MADNAFVKIGTAILRHHVKKLVGDETLSVISEEFAGIGGQKLDDWLADESTVEQLEKAALDAQSQFRDKVGDPALEQWLVSLPLGNLPKVVEAIEELPKSPDESKLESALRESIALNWRNLSPEQVNNALDSFLSCLRSALLPIEKQTLMMIGRSVLRTEEKLNLLLGWFDKYIIRYRYISNSEVSGTVSNSANIEEIFDLEAYTNELNRLYLEANIENLYVPIDGWLEIQNGQRVEISLDQYIEEWLQEKKGHLAILGDYGTGKSWFCLKVAKFLMEKYRLHPENNPLPLLITFKRYKLNMDLMELIKGDLLETYGVIIKNHFQFKGLLRSGKVLPILDGMDEMAKEVGTHTALVMFSRLGMAREIPKAIVSCRTHYFHSGSEEKEILGSDKKKQLLTDFPQFSIVHIRPFDEHKILDSINRRFQRKKALEILSFVRNTYNLPELCTRPVLLSMVCESYDALPRFNYTLSSSDLYDAYIDAWLQREMQQGRLVLDPQIVRAIFEDLAEELVAKGTLIIRTDTLRAKFENALKVARFPDDTWQAIERQLTTSTFIKHYGFNDWQFVHRSFQEFFYASKFFRWEEETEGKGTFSVTAIPVWQFIAQMVITRWDKEKAAFWIHPRVKRQDDLRTLTATTLRAAAAYWLLKQQPQSLRTYSLAGVMLDSVDLSNLDLSDCNLSDSDFHDSDFSSTKLVNTNLENSDLTNACFIGADLQGANLKGCNIQSADFRNANFGIQYSSIWLKAMNDIKTWNGRAYFDMQVSNYLGM